MFKIQTIHVIYYVKRVFSCILFTDPLVFNILDGDWRAAGLAGAVRGAAEGVVDGDDAAWQRENDRFGGAWQAAFLLPWPTGCS